MPASIALRATDVMAAPSNGNSTMASTLSLMKVSTCEICRLTSFVPSALMSSTSSYVLAWATAFLVIALIQPWSAAGAEKAIRTFLPASSFSPPWLETADPPSSPLLVQAPSTNADAAKAPMMARLRRRRERWMDMDCSLLVVLAMGGWSARYFAGQCAAAAGRRPR
jgi:hypothetical protein